MLFVRYIQQNGVRHIQEDDNACAPFKKITFGHYLDCRTGITRAFRLSRSFPFHCSGHKGIAIACFQTFECTRRRLAMPRVVDLFGALVFILLVTSTQKFPIQTMQFHYTFFHSHFQQFFLDIRFTQSSTRAMPGLTAPLCIFRPIFHLPSSFFCCWTCDRLPEAILIALVMVTELFDEDVCFTACLCDGGFCEEPSREFPSALAFLEADVFFCGTVSAAMGVSELGILPLAKIRLQSSLPDKVTGSCCSLFNFVIIISSIQFIEK